MIGKDFYETMAENPLCLPHRGACLDAESLRLIACCD
jgi:hypothetical protein